MVLVVAMIILTLGCGGGSSTTTRMRVMNAAPGQPSIDILIDGNVFASGVLYTAATGYLTLGSGSHHLQIEPSGTSTIVVDQTINLNSGTDSTVFTTENLSVTSAFVLTDDNTAPTSGNLKLRVVNAASTLGAADVYIVAPAADITSINPTVNALAVGGGSPYQSLVASTYEIFFTNRAEKFPVIDSGFLTFGPSEVRTVVAIDGTEGLTSVVLDDLN